MPFLTEGEILKNQGFIKPKVTKDQYQRGQLGRGEVLMPGSHGWEAYLPQLERQNQYFETMHCTVYNTLNPIEALAKKKFGEDWDKSERYTGVLGGLSPQGGSPHSVAEAIRKFGTIQQSSLPWTPDLNTFREYSSHRPMTQDKLDEGRAWLRNYTFGHEWIVSYGRSKLATAIYQLGESFNLVSTPEALKDALQYSPLGISVLAWKFYQTGPNKGKAYKGRYETDNHWTVLYDYVEGDHWKVYDSYNNCFVKLEWNYPISFAKVYSLEKADYAEADAQYIRENMIGLNVKGDKKAPIYFIYNGVKHPYRTMAEYYNICDSYPMTFKDRSFKVVAQDALDLLAESFPMDKNRIEAEKIFIDIKDSLIK